MTAAPGSGVPSHWQAAGGPAHELLRGAFGTARRTGAGLSAALLRLRRLRLVWGLRLRAVWLRSHVECRIAPDVAIGRRVRVTVAEHSRSTLVVGPHSAIGDDTLIALRGGRLLVGGWVAVRRRCHFEVAGRIDIPGPALLQDGTSLHCDEAITVGAHTALSEYVTVTDSSHGIPGEPGWLDVVRTAPVVVGAHVWIGAKATVGRGVAIGEAAVVSANSLVVRDVPDRWLASGVPAEPVRALSGTVPAAPSPAPAPGARGDVPVG